ncbi:hypothetical protein SAMN04488559_11535 [Isobaculum melis]|uniref:Uncharacterized protein n=1 Tax=Isobaculum melis TaxID=142588 RepID=A0A1H9TPE9_9LACT|nr:hypothetical protein SAMN04488559_11535 [Isobaculum melis]
MENLIEGILLLIFITVTVDNFYILSFLEYKTLKMKSNYQKYSIKKRIIIDSTVFIGFILCLLF